MLRLQVKIVLTIKHIFFDNFPFFKDLFVCMPSMSGWPLEARRGSGPLDLEFTAVGRPKCMLGREAPQ